MQAGGEFHEPIGNVWVRIAEGVFHTARTFYPGDGMFDPHAHARQRPVMAFFAWCQGFALGLFFGWWVCWTFGS